MTDHTGAVLERWDPYPFGEEWVSGLTGDRYRYTGHLRDQETGNDYAGARYYSNARGRWLSVDPVRGDVSNPQRLNRYAYVGNDPVNYNETLVTDVARSRSSLRSESSAVYWSAGDRKMRGIDFVVDEAGERKAVLIDLAEYGELWEDFYDAVLAKQREREPRETLAEVKEKLGLSGG